MKRVIYVIEYTKWDPEATEYKDWITGVRITKLTGYKGHSHHLYFTNSGWYRNGKKLLFGSDRDNRTNLFSIDLDTYEINQLTDLEPVELPSETCFLQTCINSTCDEAYFSYKNNIMALDLNTLQYRVLYETPVGFHGSLNCTSDGKYLCYGISQDVSDRIKVPSRDDGIYYAGFRETFEARPLSKILRINTDGSGWKCIWEENTWIGHINTSPRLPNIITFCHEGPWDRVDNRIWSLDLDSGTAMKVRPRENEEIIGHEYWHADGIHIGYHGIHKDGSKLFGKIRYDNTEKLEVNFPHDTGHIHSNDFSLIVGDGYRDGRLIRLWKWNGIGFDGPRILCEHRSSFNLQKLHAHPRFAPDGKKVLFTSDIAGYGNLYLAEVPDFYSLPELDRIRL